MTHKTQKDHKFQDKFNHWLVILAITASSLTVYSHGRIIDPDFWGQLAFGSDIIENGRFPRKDFYSYMPVKDIWINHEWGTAVIFSWIYKNVGGIMFLKMTIWMIITLACYRIGRRENSYPIYIFLIYMICFSDFFIGINNRPYLFTYLFFAIFLWVINRYEKDKNIIFALPFINILWANTHGGMVAGLGILGIFFLADWYENRKIDYRIGLSLALCLLSPMINPYGVDYYTYLVPAVFMNRWYIGEWRAMDLMDFDMLNNYKILLGIIILSIPFSFERKKLYQYLILILTVYVSLKHIRHTPFFFIASMAFLPGILSNISFIPSLFKKAHVASAVALLGLIISLSSLTKRFTGNERIMNLVTPVHYNQNGGYIVPRYMVRLIKTKGLKGNMAVEFAWGEYIIRELGDRCKVSIDGRLETVYPKESIDAYFDFVNAREGKWRKLLTDYDTDMVLIRVNCPVYPKMVEEKGWALISVYYDSALFVRVNP